MLRIGPTDGNVGGAIISGSSGTYKEAAYHKTTIDFVLHIHNGTIDLSSPFAFETLSWTYGTIKKWNNSNPYSWNEFEYGAYLGYEFAADGGLANTSGHRSVSTSLRHQRWSPSPRAVWLLGSGLLGLIGIRRRFRK